MVRYVSFRLLVLFAVASLVLAAAAPAHADGPTSVLTRSYSNSRTGANLNEVVLNTSNVTLAQFGKLFTRTVDGQIYAQPLYVPDVTIPGKGVHNVVYVATQHNSVFAFDADDPAESAPLWQVNLGASIPSSDFGFPGYDDISDEVGITSTPVIDPATGTLYVVPTTRDTDGVIRHRLHALDIQTGQEKFGGPVIITGSVSKTGGPGHDIVFDSSVQLQRPGLLLSNGAVYIAFGSYNDWGNYYGWIFGYAAATLQQVYIFNAAPAGGEGSIWQAGQGLSADSSGNIYAVTANGAFNAQVGGPDYGNSFIKLDPSAATNGILPVTDWFTPHDQAVMSANDEDVGSSGPLLIPGTSLVLGAGKSGDVFLVDRNAMSHYNNPDQMVQRFAPDRGGIYGSLVYWNSPSGPLVYTWPADDFILAFRFNGAQLQTTPAAVGSPYLQGIWPGGTLSLSANGSTPGSGILWSTEPREIKNGWESVLHAYDASNINIHLWSSDQNSGRDGMGHFVKFNPPMVADGKVFVGTTSNKLVVYGLFAPGIVTQPRSQMITADQAVTMTVRAVGPAPLTYQWYEGNAGDTSQPVGTDSPSFVSPSLAATTHYWVRVSNSSGHADSRVADVAVVGQILQTFLPVVMNGSE
jgi:hypothetical protein